MRTGRQKIDGEWYYFVSSGYMYWGWLQQGDNWYFLERYKGPMVTGTVVIDGYTFHFADTGEWIPD
jgi:glucan-binding YG repeat protein